MAATLEARGTKASAALGVEEQVRKLGAGKPEVWLEDTRAELEVLDGLSPGAAGISASLHLLRDPQPG